MGSAGDGAVWGWSHPYLLFKDARSFEYKVNIILPSMPGSSKWSLSLRFPHQNPVYASPLPHTRYMPRPFILLDFITRKIFGKQYRSFSSSLRSTKEPCIDIKWVKFVTKMDVAGGCSHADSGCVQASRAALCGHAHSNRQPTLAVNF